MPKNNHYTLSFEDAKKIVHSYGFKTTQEWDAFPKSDKRPINIPKKPESVYKDKWKGVLDWIGAKQHKKLVRRKGTNRSIGSAKTFVSYEEAKAHVQKLGIKTHDEFRLWSKTKRPLTIPGNPSKFYGDKFEGWSEYFGLQFGDKPQQMPDLFVEVQQQPEQLIEIEEATNSPEQIEQAPIEKPQSSDLGKFVQAYQLMAEAHSQLLGLFAEMIEGNRAK